MWGWAKLHRTTWTARVNIAGDFADAVSIGTRDRVGKIAPGHLQQ